MAIMQAPMRGQFDVLPVSRLLVRLRQKIRLHRHNDAIRWALPFQPVAATPNASQIPRHTPLRNDNTEFLKLSVDLRGSPTLVLVRQAPDQNANLLGDLRSAAPRPGSPAPIEPEAGAVPADHGVGLHEDQDVRPAGPTLAECRSEAPVQGVQCWPRPFPFHHGELLSEGEDFDGCIASSAKEDSDGDKEREDGFGHELTLLTRRNVASPGRRCEIAGR